VIEGEGFVVITEGAEEAVDHGAFDEDLFEEAEAGSWKRGDRAGSATFRFVATPGGNALYTIVLQLDGRGTIVASGRLPHKDDRLRDGFLVVTGGTEEFQDARGAIKVDFMNPKRYTYPA
jgi:hypothetical protein